MVQVLSHGQALPGPPIREHNKDWRPFHLTPEDLYGALAQYYDVQWLSLRTATYWWVVGLKGEEGGCSGLRVPNCNVLWLSLYISPSSGAGRSNTANRALRMIRLIALRQLRVMRVRHACSGKRLA